MTQIWPLFPDECPEIGTQQLQRSYCFSFMPHGLFSRFCVLFLRDFQPLVMWSNGILMEMNGCTILVEYSLEARQQVYQDEQPQIVKDINELKYQLEQVLLNLDSEESQKIIGSLLPDMKTNFKRINADLEKNYVQKNKKMVRKDFTRTNDSLSRKFSLCSSFDEYFFSTGKISQMSLCENELSIQIRGRDWQQIEQSLEIIADTILEGTAFWSGLSWKCTAAAPSSIAAHQFPPQKMDLADIENALVQGKPLTSEMIQVAPDIALTNAKVNRLNYEDLHILEELGSGGFAVVRKAKWKEQTVAVKELLLNTDSTDWSAFHEFRHEIKIHSKLSHPNIVALMGICMNPFCIILEFLGWGTLHQLLQSNPMVIHWDLRLKVVSDIAAGLSYMHSLPVPIVHIDLKAANVMLASLDPRAQICAKVVDFGTSREYRHPLFGRPVDNPVYLAPEILLNQEYKPTVDTYAFGVILWESITRKMYFGDIKFLTEVETSVKTGKRPPIPSPADGCPETFNDLISSCWAANPAARPSWRRINRILTSLKEADLSIMDDLQLPIQKVILEARAAAAPIPVGKVQSPGHQNKPGLVKRKAVLINGSYRRTAAMKQDTFTMLLPDFTTETSVYDPEASLYPRILKELFCLQLQTRKLSEENVVLVTPRGEELHGSKIKELKLGELKTRTILLTSFDSDIRTHSQWKRHLAANSTEPSRLSEEDPEAELRFANVQEQNGDSSTETEENYL